MICRKGLAPIRQMVAGADGALWVTALDANKIVKLSTDGKVLAEYPLPTCRQPSRRHGGRAGWRVLVYRERRQPDRAHHAGGRHHGISDPHGEQLSHPPDGGAGQRPLVQHDCAPTRSAASASTGEITEYDTPGMGPLGLAAGADGAIWFTGYNSTEIGRLTTDGVLTKLSIPTYAAVPYHIVAGPDGNLWFTEQQGNQIGQIKLPGGDDGADLAQCATQGQCDR